MLETAVDQPKYLYIRNMLGSTNTARCLFQAYNTARKAHTSRGDHCGLRANTNLGLHGIVALALSCAEHRHVPATTSYSDGY